MVLYKISGVVPYNFLGTVVLSEIENKVITHIRKTHPDCQQIQNDYCKEEISVVFDTDGVYYEYAIEA